MTNCWEVSLPIDVSGLTDWLCEIKNRWPGVKFITQGVFGLIWMSYFKTNSFNCRFEQTGSGIGGSDKDKKIRWFMNSEFRFALLQDINDPSSEKVIDITQYTLPAKEPAEMTRKWSLPGMINQKQTRTQDKPAPLTELSSDTKAIIKKHYSYLFP